ncbi:MAG: Gfo/Idh/MocA family protein [Bryobacteraceae bacterium]
MSAAVPAAGSGNKVSLPPVGFKSLNEKLNIAVIGLGMRGPQILPGAAASENIVALCDVDDERAAPTFEQYPKAKRYKNWRKMLDTEGKSLDAVMVAVPDHWHTHMSLECMQRGKHVYCEKPLTRTIWEARLLAEAAAKYKVATQMGNQGFNHEGTKTACEIFWSGEIGDVREVHSWTGGGSGDRHYPASGPPEQPVPAALDWDTWLGPAAARPYNADMRSWRSFLDFSAGGTLGDWLVHCLGPAHLALKLDQAAPISVEARNVVERNAFNWPASDEVVYEFPARGNLPPVTIHAYQAMRGDFKNPEGMAETDRLLPPADNLATDKNRAFVDGGDGMLLVGNQLDVHGQKAPPPPQTGRAPAGRGRAPVQRPGDRGPGNGTVFVGSKGHMATSGRGEGVWLLPASRWADYRLPPQILPRGVNHQQDWIRACKGGAPGVSEFAVTTKYIEWLVLGAVALRVPGKLLWDARNMRFTNSEEANKYLKPIERKGWELKV